MNFLGINNVIDAQAIYGKDGVADGFRVTYEEIAKNKLGQSFKHTKQKTVWVREYSAENDGMLHGFGNPTVYSRSAAKKQKKEKVQKKLSASGMAKLGAILNRKVD